MASATAAIHAVTREPPPLATMRVRRDAGRVEHPADDEAARLEGGPLERLGARADVEAVEVGPQRVVLEGRALAAHVGQPDRHPVRVAQARREPLAVGTGPRRAAQQVAGPVDEQRAGVAGAADQEAVGRGVREADQARRPRATRR